MVSKGQSNINTRYFWRLRRNMDNLLAGAAFGTAALLDAYGVGDVPIGELDLTPGLIERARAERGDAPLA